MSDVFDRARRPDHAPLAGIIAEAQAAIVGLTSIIQTAQHLAEGATPGVQRPIEQPLNAPPEAFQRPKPSSKIARDPELQAFITARLADHTFDQIVAAIAANFPPERRSSRSALSRWCQRKAAALRPSTSANNRQISDIAS